MLAIVCWIIRQIWYMKHTIAMLIQCLVGGTFWHTSAFRTPFVVSTRCAFGSGAKDICTLVWYNWIIAKQVQTLVDIVIGVNNLKYITAKLRVYTHVCLWVIVKSSGTCFFTKPLVLVKSAKDVKTKSGFASHSDKIVHIVLSTYIMTGWCSIGNVTLIICIKDLSW